MTASAAGFTVLELLIALSLHAALAAAAALAYADMRPESDLAAAARRVALDLTAARLRALTRQATHRIVFAEGSGTYVRQRKVGAAFADDGAPAALPAGITIAQCTANDDTVSFRPRGNASTFGTLTLRNSRGRERRVVVGITGQIRVQP